VQFLPEAPGGSMATRFLVAWRLDPALEFVESILPRTARTPILFIHGAFGGAWIWTEPFMRHAAKRGRRSAALSARQVPTPSRPRTVASVAITQRQLDPVQGMICDTLPW
jgi:pimeloyl-ACP methyl ester carboxylesterase